MTRTQELMDRLEELSFDKSLKSLKKPNKKCKKEGMEEYCEDGKQKVEGI